MWEWASAQGVTTIPLGFSVYFLSPPLGSALCKIGLVPTTSQERECKCTHAQGHSEKEVCLGTWKTVLLHIHLSGHGLRVLIVIENYITTGSIAHVFPMIQSVIIRCMYIQNICEPLMDSWLPEITWGHSRASRVHVLGLEKPLWLTCICCVLEGAGAGVREGSVVIFVAYLWTLLGVSGEGFRDQLASFPVRAPFLLRHNFLPSMTVMGHWIKGP